MSENASDTVWLTQDAYDKLANELAYLKGTGRAEVTAKIAAARNEGDLSENGGYHAARDEQGQQEARIRQLEQMLRHAKVGEAPADPSEIAPGFTVTIAYDGDLDDTDTFLLGSREMLGVDDSVDVQVYSPQSPIGSAVLGRHVDDEVTYEAPNGKALSATIIKVVPFGG